VVTFFFVFSLFLLLFSFYLLVPYFLVPDDTYVDYLFVSFVKGVPIHQRIDSTRLYTLQYVKCENNRRGVNTKIFFGVLIFVWLKCARRLKTKHV